LPKRSLIEINEKGFWEEKDGELMTRSIENKDCVFVFYENNIAKCSIEKTYYEKQTEFIKPLSCHLFPIRISDFGGDVIRYEKYSDCEPALKNGEKTGLSILEFCEKPLKRAYNNNFYKKLEKINGK
jgi:hypothetical protein